MVMKALGIEKLPTQREFYAHGGDMIFSVDSLASTLNEVCEGSPFAQTWSGGWISGWHDPSQRWQVIQRLASTGSWIAHMRMPLEPVGHFVTVTLVTADRVDILDPQFGTSYSMSGDEFFEAWNGQAVFSTKRTA
jgi:hypothetical protein